MAKEPKDPDPDDLDSKFASEDDFRAWLTDKPRGAAVAIAARAALRVLPLVALDVPENGSSDQRQQFFILVSDVFRATAESWIAAGYPVWRKREWRRSPISLRAHSLASSSAAVSADHARSVVFLPFELVPASVVWAASDAGKAIVFAHMASEKEWAVLARFGAWHALEDDARYVDKRQRSRMTSRPLWSHSIPTWAAEHWMRLQDSLPLDDDWQVWIDWYDRRLKGVVDPKRIELIYASVPESEWDKGPAAANAWIKERLEEARGEEKAELDPPPPADAQPISVPAQKPATVEPIIRGGKITLPEGAAEPELDADSFSEALKALRSLVSDFASDLDGEANIDKRAIGVLRRIGARIPDEAPSQAQLFELAHQQETLEDYSKKVVAEWPDLLASRYLGVVRAFDGTMRQFAKWRTFKQNALKDCLTEAQRANAPILARRFASALRESNNASQVDVSIPTVINNMAQEIEREADGILPREPSVAGADTRPEDLVVSIENTIKCVGYAAAKANVERKAQARFGAKVAKGFAGQFEGEKLGENLGKWATNALLAVGAGYVATHPTELGNILAELMQQYPIIAQWLQPLIDHLRR